MKGDDDQPAALAQNAFGCRKGIGELVELAIDENAERLERARRRVNGIAAASTDCARHNVGEVRGGFQRTDLGSGLIAVPSNVGPRTMPNYDALAAQGIHDLGNGIRVFAGQRDDPFYIDLGGLFDTLNLGLSPLPIETNAQDANDGANAFGVDMLIAGFAAQVERAGVSPRPSAPPSGTP